VFLSRRAKKALDDSPLDIRKKLESKISQLVITSYPSGCRKLKGVKNAYRLRAGNYHILYTILKEEEILIFKIAHRESAYKG
jgi:mRNA interferase RelE/StbE